MSGKNRGIGEFLSYALLTAGAMLTFSVYTMVSGVIVSHGAGEAALAALNLSMPLVNMMFAVSVLMSVGAATVIGVHRGAGELQLAKRAFTEDIFAVLGASLLVVLITALFPCGIARFLGGTELTLGRVEEYVRVTGAFAPAYMLSYNLEVMSRADGRPHMALAGVSTCGAVTVGLGWLFVMRMGLGMRGAALAAGLGQTASILVYLTHFLSRRAKLRLAFARPVKGLFRRALPLGLSDFSNEVVLALTTFLYNRALLMAVGVRGVVSYAVVSFVNTLAVMLFAGVAQANQPLVSRSRGAKDHKGMFAFYGYGVVTALALGLLLYGACLAFAPGIARLVIEPGSSALPYTAAALRMFAAVFPLAGLNIVTSGFLAATEAPRYAAAISLGRGASFALALFVLAALAPGDALWYAALIAEGLCAAASAAFFLRRRKEILR
ncbi:MAG: hypothetical protein LLF87_09045 [Eubacteriales bacterium]|nr:hypothetical protein [Eubacteriales bacterium]